MAVRIVVNDCLGHAPQVQLSRALAARGHAVLHLYSSDAQSPKADLRRKDGDAPGLQIEGLTAGGQRGASFFANRLRERRLGRIFAKRALAFRPDIFMGCNNPLDTQRVLQRACRARSIPFVYWMQDFYAMQIDRALAGRSAILSVPIGGYYHGLERALLQRSSAVVTVANDHVGILAESWDVYDRQCMVVNNWAPLDTVMPRPKPNDWAKAQGLAGGKVVLYAGRLGSMENPGLLVELASQLRSRPDVKVVIVSEGAGAEMVAAEARSRGIEGLRVLPYQPYEMYADVLASADVLIGQVAAEAGILFVPSKVSSYLCAGRPIVLAAPSQNVAAQFVRESGGGRVTAPDDPVAMAEAVRVYLDDAGLWNEASRRSRLYAEQSFDIEKIATRFERLFERLVSGPPRRRTAAVVSPA